MLGNWEGEQREGGWGSLIRAWVDFTGGGGARWGADVCLESEMRD